MRHVERIDNPENSKSRTLFYDIHSYTGWVNCELQPDHILRVVYLGKCSHDGDMFAIYTKNGQIQIVRGELNDGVYE
jgi:hypothetical protein